MFLQVDFFDLFPSGFDSWSLYVCAGYCDLTYAAKKGLVYHLWWHPHNFGDHTEDNLAFLKMILDRYPMLKKAYGMESLNMFEVGQSVDQRKDRGYDLLPSSEQTFN